MAFACRWVGFVQASCQECGQVLHAIPSVACRAPQWSRLPHRLRSPECPNGLPNLLDKDRGVVAEGKVLAQRSGILLAACIVRGLPCGEENAAQPYLRP
eukprot:964141-Pyramimonas_sp.AAC.1